MHDAADYPAIINPPLAACVSWQQRRESPNCSSVSQK
jgi:hypothetical protein